MKCIKYLQAFFIPVCLAVLCMHTAVAQQHAAPVVEFVQPLAGTALVVNATSVVENDRFFNSAYSTHIDGAYPVRNMVTLKINEQSATYLAAPFTATLSVRIRYTNSSLTDTAVTRSFQVKYDTGAAYRSQDLFLFENAQRVTLQVLSIQVVNAAGQAVTGGSYPYLILENKMQVQPRYQFNCALPVTNLVATDSAKANPDELYVSWNDMLGAEEYDLEWTYIDSIAFATIYGNSFNATRFFDNNASRVSIKGVFYSIPLLYNEGGYLCFRVRPVQYTGAQRVEGVWTSLSTNQGVYTFGGHERRLNWQATTSYAEDGKRKVVVQYYDGSLRGRQTVTKDNSLNRTIVAESFYDKQGRAAIQVLPVPTLNSIIGYSRNFNVGLNGSEYDKSRYDTLTSPAAYCNTSAEAMGVTSGASRYYSSENPEQAGINSYIPDAGKFPFTETQYTPDGTGRIKRQGGVGPGYQLGSGHETQYIYASPTQKELDALFGTEAGNYKHYFKNAVRDANGQYSVTYVDLHGRTIATALAGDAPEGMNALPGNNFIQSTENLADAKGVSIRDGIIEHKTSLFVAKQDDYTFHYSLHPDSLLRNNCSDVPVCYSCLYDLRITITDDCNNQKLPGQKAFDTTLHNFSIGSVSGNALVQGFSLDFILDLKPGNYEVTKQLSISRYGTDYYRDSVFMKNNACRSLLSFINEQRSIVKAGRQCVTICPDCDQNGAQAMRTALLLDVTPPSGQYADVSRGESQYSVFWSQQNHPARYQQPGLVYLNELGVPDTVIDSRTGNRVTPDQLDAEQFIDKFKASWASTLLPLHPEYCKLLEHEKYNASFNWDRKFEDVETFQDALNLGYLNPTTNTSATPFTGYTAVAANKDSLLLQYPGLTQLLEQKMLQYAPGRIRLNAGATDVTFNIWAMATISARLGDADTTGIAEAYTQPFKRSLCASDLDMAWKAFRSLYLQVKQGLISDIVANASCPAGFTNVAVSAIQGAGFQPHFISTNAALSAAGLGYANSGNTNTAVYKDSANAAMAAQFDANCRAYAKLWAEQLSCYGQAALDSIIPRLIQVCKEGSDAAHVNGSSSVRPASTYQYRSFQEVINDYNSRHPFAGNVFACNAELITAPRPYDAPASYSNVPIYTRPDSCQCVTITALYDIYRKTIPSGLGVSFSQYLREKHNTTMSDADLTTLINLCKNSGTASCKNLPTPIYLPPALQCGMQNLCVPCYTVTNMYGSFKSAFPGMLPSTDTTQQQQLINNLFAAYMNNRLGFSKSTGEYLSFINTCTSDSALGRLWTQYCSPELGTTGRNMVVPFGEAGNPNDPALRNVHFNSITQSFDGGFVMAGRAEEYPYLLGISDNGEVLWSRYYPTGPTGQFERIIASNDNSYLAMGSYGDFSNPGTDLMGRGPLIVKVSDLGELQWMKTVASTEAMSEPYVAYDAVNTNDGYVVLANAKEDPLAVLPPDTGPYAGLRLYKLDYDGNVVWARVVNWQSQESIGGRLYYNQSQNVISIATSVKSVEANRLLPCVFQVNNNSGSVVTGSHKLYKNPLRHARITNFESINGQLMLSCLVGSYIPDQGVSQGLVLHLANNGNYISNSVVDCYNNFTSSVSRSLFQANPSQGYLTAFSNADYNGLLSYNQFNNQGARQDYNDVRLNYTGLYVKDIANVGGNFFATLCSNGYDNPYLVLTSAAGRTDCPEYDYSGGQPIRQVSITLSTTENINYEADVPASSIDIYGFDYEVQQNIASVINCHSLCQTVYAGPRLCGSARALFNLPEALSGEIDNCTDTSFFIHSAAIEKYQLYQDSLRGGFENAYTQKCLEAYKYESFTVSRRVSEYHYTLYYYDQAGNLKKTVPPAGVHPVTDATWLAEVEAARKAGTLKTPDHTMATSYKYNTLNQVVEQKTPDAGVSRFWYDRLGRLVLSQNAKQAASQQYSYTRYDYLGRITEVGQLTSAAGISNDISRDDAALAGWLNNVAATREQITVTVYDQAYSPLSPAVLTAANLRNRIAYSAVYNTAADMLDNNNFSTASFYSYDIAGNVDTLIQNYKAAAMVNTGNQFKKLVYQYDLVSGKVNHVAYQPKQPDAFYHRYQYDAENRLVNAETSRDSVTWENDAWYAYYKHGPLARTVLGQQQVQGLDYVYTLQGWIKAVNPEQALTGGVLGNGANCGAGTAVDNLVVNARIVPGGPPTYTARNSIDFESGFVSGSDEEIEASINSALPVCTSTGPLPVNNDGTNPSAAAADAFSYVLHYNNTDYKGINAATPDAQVPTQLGSAYRPLYNGNISGMGVNIKKLNTPLWYNYKYDQLNRLAQMDAWKASSGSWVSLQSTSDYGEGIVYDGNGNITQYDRYGIKNRADAADSIMDRLTYHYATGTNQLTHINDQVPASYYSTDIDDQAAGNYTYDAIGNLTKDLASQITAIQWNVFGKIQRITKSDGTIVNYTYDASGNRVSKMVGNDITWYVRDASGNVMTIYTGNNSGLQPTEVPLYGSSRLGMLRLDAEQLAQQPDLSLPELGIGKSFIFKRGAKLFELSNHLGNVLATVSDKRVQVGSGSTLSGYAADVVSAQDYYPFGMLQPGRSFNAGGYRYGFNGKENDNEVKGEGNQQDYGMRIYDPRIGKFLSVDPLTRSYPMLTPYQFASNMPIAAIDLDGLEGLIATGVNGAGVVVSPESAEAVKKRTVVNAFKAGFSHYLPKELLEHYAYGKGKTYTLNEQKMRDINPMKIGIEGIIKKDIDQFQAVLKKLPLGKSISLKDWKVFNGSLTSGGLGGYTVIFEGVLTKDKGDPNKWTFAGTMQFYDNWNFKSHANAVASGEKDYRSAQGDMVTTLAREHLPGQAFDIYSEKVKVKQTNDETFVDWFKGFTPESVPNRVYQNKDLSSGVSTDKH